MTRWHLLWLVASFFLAFGINAQMKPVIEFEQANSAAVGTGKLELVIDERVQSFELAAIEVLAKDITRTFGAPIQVRELLLSSPQDATDAAPDVRLYVDFAAPHISPNARDVELLRGRELDLLPEPPGRGERSRLRMPGESEPAEVESGTLVITDAIELDTEDGSASWRVGGRVDLQLREGEALRTLSGNIKARLRWQ